MTIAPTPPGSWLAGIAQLLDEHHLVVVADDRAASANVGRAAAARQAGMPHASLQVIAGSEIVDAESFAAHVAHGLGAADGVRSLDGLATLLRTRPDDARFRYMLWLNADETLERDVALFGRIVNMLFSIAAEHEHLTVEPLLIQRVILTGGAKLGAYAEEEAGQFRSWLPGTKVAECIERPPVLTYRVDG